MNHLTTAVKVPGVGTVDVSTIDLSINGFPGLTGFETCLFWGQESEVVATYPNWAEAAEAHEAWTNPSVLASVIRRVNQQAVTQ